MEHDLESTISALTNRSRMTNNKHDDTFEYVKKTVNEINQRSILTERSLAVVQGVNEQLLLQLSIADARAIAAEQQVKKLNTDIERIYEFMQEHAEFQRTLQVKNHSFQVTTTEQLNTLIASKPKSSFFGF